ncbi:hypothetical protein EUZ93_00825 [Wolbachia pipientis]|nr:hypothetical protein [Wolbachia pipientis]
MHSNNDKESRGNRVIPSDRFERVGPDKHEREARQRERESSKPATQLGSSSATGASSSKGKSK